MLENPWSAVGNPTSALGPSGSSFGPYSLAHHLLLSNLTTADTYSVHGCFAVLSSIIRSISITVCGWARRCAQTGVFSREPERGSGAVVEGANANSGHGLAHGRRRTAAAVRSSHVERRGRAAALSWRAGSHERDGGEARVIGGDEVVGVSARVSLERVADVVDVTQLTGALEYTAARDQTTPNHVHRQHLHTHTHTQTDLHHTTPHTYPATRAQ